MNLKKINIIYILVLTFLITESPLGFCDTSDLKNIHFNHISTEHGLSQKTIEVIYQDRHGFIWFGTQEGLNRFDGIKIKIFRHFPNDVNSLSHDVIQDILEDQNGVLWVATKGGLNKFNATDESFERVKFNDVSGNLVLSISSLYKDKSGKIWIGTESQGLFSYSDENLGIKDEQNANTKKILSNGVRAIYEDSRGRLWIGTDGNGVIVLDQKRNQEMHFVYEKNSLSSISHNRVRSIIEDYRGQIWIGTRGGGLSKFDELSKTFINYKNNPNDSQSLSHDRVYDIFEDKNRTLWIATDGGLNIFNSEQNNFDKIQHRPSQYSGLSHNRVNHIFQDSGEIMWFGTFSGIDQWDRRTLDFVHYRNISEDSTTLTHNHVHDIVKGINGSIYIATFGDGINLYQPDLNKFNKILNQGSVNEILDDKFITSLFMDKDKQLWIGTLSKGVYVISDEKKIIKHFENNTSDSTSILADGITDIIQDSDGETWIATYNTGLNRLNGKDDNFTHYLYEPDNPELSILGVIFQVMEDDEGYIWSATNGGISRLDKNTGVIKNFTHSSNKSDSLSGSIAWSIYQDSKGRFWIGTQGNGLNRWEASDRRRGIDKFKHYNVENGLNSSTINGVLEDEKGAIWISTNQGVSKLDPENDTFIHYNLASEQHKNEFNLNSMFKANNGRFYIGGTNGISAFYPNAINQNFHLPNVVLTKISSEGHNIQINKAISELTEIVFSYNDYLITFEFASLDFAQPKKNQYQYKLEGLDSDWVSIGNFNRATFTNLPSGNYILKVKGSNNDGLWSEESINLKIKVLPAPWATWWAFSIYATLFILILILIIRSQAKRLANQEMFKSLVSDEVDQRTAVYVKNNEFLNKQMEQLKFYSNVDLDTGLPNQKYLCDLIKANLQWVNQFKNINRDTCLKLCVALIRLPAKSNHLDVETNEVINKIAKQFSSKVDELEVDFKVTIRWGESELGVVFYCDNESESERFVKLLLTQLTDIVTNLMKQNFNLHPLKAGFCLSPLSGVNQNEMSSDNFLMLTEHLLHLVVKEKDKNIVGCLGANQKLNSNKIKQILEVEKLNELKDILVLN